MNSAPSRESLDHGKGPGYPPGSEVREMKSRVPARISIGLPWTVAALLCLWAVTAPSGASGEDLPFRPGERLHFNVYWSGLPVGEATLGVLDDMEVGGRPVRHFFVSVRTNDFADLIYKVRTRVDAYTTLDLDHSLLYLKKQREGSRKRDVRVELDPGQGTARYSRPGKKKTLSIPPRTFDPLSVFYAFRLQDLRVGAVLQAPVTDGKRCVTGVARVTGKETMRVGPYEVETFVVEPDLKEAGGVFEKTENARLKVWVTADPRRIPVRVESEVVVGRFHAELAGVEGIW